MPLLALVSFPATASADPERTMVMKMPVSQTFVSCTGDMVTMTGEQTIGIHMSTDTSGGTHLKFSTETRGITGIGWPSGKKYQGLETVEHSIQVPQGATTETFVQNFSLIRQGDLGNVILGDDMRMRQTNHMTFNSLGVPTSIKSDNRAECS
jgi:hypothetical protein